MHQGLCHFGYHHNRLHQYPATEWGRMETHQVYPSSHLNRYLRNYSSKGTGRHYRQFRRHQNQQFQEDCLEKHRNYHQHRHYLNLQFQLHLVGTHQHYRQRHHHQGP